MLLAPENAQTHSDPVYRETVREFEELISRHTRGQPVILVNLYDVSADIVYSTNNELAFDYLRDNMKFSQEDMVQRGFHYGIVDEVDSILIDEARTPLIISGQIEENNQIYKHINKIVTK